MGDRRTRELCEEETFQVTPEFKKPHIADPKTYILFENIINSAKQPQKPCRSAF
jgi:hypothetical protein